MKIAAIAFALGMAYQRYLAPVVNAKVSGYVRKLFT